MSKSPFLYTIFSLCPAVVLLYNAALTGNTHTRSEGICRRYSLIRHPHHGPRTMTIALHDVTVLDFSQGLSGPFCSLLLGDLGARVLKVEPLGGDWARQLKPRQGNHSAVFLTLNRNKISIALDYQSAAGQEVVQRLARRADMVLYDAHPKQPRTLGVGYAV